MIKACAVAVARKGVLARLGASDHPTLLLYWNVHIILF